MVTPLNVSIALDAEGYFPSFEKDQIKEYTTFLKEVGVVVINNVLDKAQCNKTIDELWTNFKKRRPKIDRNDPTTWEDFPGIKSVGMFPEVEAIDLVACENRQNPNVYNAFKNVLGQENLWVSFDRFGVLRPTKGILIPGSETKEDRPNWKTSESWLQWDMNPWVYVERLKSGKKEKENYKNFSFMSENNDNYDYLDKVQGLIALDDTPFENGGFLAVLGFDKCIEKWAEDHKYLAVKNNYRHYVSVPKDDPMFQQTTKIPVRSGSLIIWRGSIPHSNYPNNCGNFRYCQYLKMFPVPDIGNVEMFNSIQKCIKDSLPKEFQLTELGEKLYRQKSWITEFNGARIHNDAKSSVEENFIWESI